MVAIRRWAATFGSLALCIPALPAAQEPPKVTIDPSALEAPRVPFDPPSGSALLYRIVTEYEGDRAPAGSAFEQVLRFRFRDGGYLLDVETPTATVDGVRYGQGGRAPDPSMPPQLLLSLSAPMTFETDGKGLMLRGHDWAAHQQKLVPVVRSALPESARRLGTALPTEAELEQFIRAFVETSAESALNGVGQHWHQILGFGGARGDGTANEWSDTRTFMKGEAVLAIDNSFTATPQANGFYRIVRQRTEDPDGFAEAIDTARSRGDRELIEEGRRMFNPWVMDLTLVTRTDFTIDPRGVPMAGTLEIEQARDGKMRTLQRFTFKLVSETAAPAPATEIEPDNPAAAAGIAPAR